ncbi:MAG: type II toxin-antitoxin system VapC family toxin [Anaerolineae bacterium]
MPIEVFVDAGAWVAVGDVRDQHHALASRYYSELLKQKRSLITTNLVVAEAYVLILRSSGHMSALRFLNSVRYSSFITRVYSTAALEAQAETILRRYADQDFSLTDAVSFTLMRERGISAAFAFDSHFATMGFTLVPPPL